MNWKKASVFSLVLFLASFLWMSFNKKYPKKSSSTKLLENSPQISRPSSTKKKLEMTSPLNIKHSQFNKKKWHKSNKENHSPVIEEKHIPIVDTAGNLYPTAISVIEGKLIAYGDIIVGDAKFIDEYKSGKKELKVAKPKLWPEGIIPYVIKDDVTNTQKVALKNIFKEINYETSIQFVEFNPSKHKHHVQFIHGENHCFAQVGYFFDNSQVSLSPGCGYKEMFHEVFHVLGFFHEQNRFDRDEHVKVLWENIEEDYWAQFEKFPEQLYEGFKEALGPFTFDTIMIYSSTDFSRSEDYSMVNIYGDGFETPENPTPIDYGRLKKLYAPFYN